MKLKVTRKIVDLAYRLFLGRPPESEEAIRDALGYGDLVTLREAFIKCDEFSDCFNRLAGPPRFRVSLHAPQIDVDIEVSDFESSAILAHIEKEWRQLGMDKPHWSVLSSALFAPENIQGSEGDFFKTGADDVAWLITTLARNGIAHNTLLRVFEYGCGLGRVTVHLAQYFDQVSACDISSSHLALTKKYVEMADIKNVRLELAEINDLGMKEGFDLWYSKIVLQHNPPPIIALILRRALRLLAPGGVAVFQVPTYAYDYSFKIKDYLKQIPSGIEMHVLPQTKIFQIIREQGCEVLEVREDEAVGNEHRWISNQFVLRKNNH